MEDIVMYTPSAPASTTPMNQSLLARAAEWIEVVYSKLDWLAPLAFLLLRIWVAWQFFKSGLTKLPIENAIVLFENEYHVPLLPPVVAAYLGTTSELVFSTLLTLGLVGRFSALALFILNFVAYISYSEALLSDHLPWGLILFLFVLHGPDKLSLDYLLGKSRRWPL
jgi:putative oxidoreductase